ncbi:MULTISPECIES: hypothetical protein [Thermus]|uniref:HTTM domain-containing protein n=1 Tax=Thermus brockianus TaxID=56956 RepID=A0A1J0LYB0_THEBO|nr:hypothetical protein [Thermus brockianus]APD10447.1 hypothetical protein A0O31_02422 [Thermus brockianus]
MTSWRAKPRAWLGYLYGSLFGLSPLGLTLSRLILGGTLFADWLFLARWYEAFFSERGLFRRHEVLEVSKVDVPLFFGSEAWNLLLFGAIGALSLLFVLGYRPRLMALLLALLLLGLQSRNPWVWNTGHALIQRGPSVKGAPRLPGWP